MTNHHAWDGPPLNIDPTRQPVLNHRSGWAFALEALAPLHDPQGVLFDSFLERTFSWVERTERNLGRIPYREPWIGVMHNPPGVPRWHDYRSSPQALLARDSFRESLPHCLGLFTLSAYLQQWLKARVSVPVSSLVHPTEIPSIRFSPEEFLADPRPAVIQVGWWLRRLHSIFRLRAGRFRKVMLAVQHHYFRHMLDRDCGRTPLQKADIESVTVQPFVSNEHYDRLLSKNIVFCDLIDSSANNVVIECIVRNTPLLVNRLPAVEEYLGRDYPLYFSDLDEASAKLSRPDTILAAHDYLHTIPKPVFSQQAFRQALLCSDVYRHVCNRTSGRVRCRFASPDSRDESRGEVDLVLSRAASGVVYVERAEFTLPPAGRQDDAVRPLQRLLCGLPVASVRQLTLDDFRQHVDVAADAELAYEALKRALDRI